MEASRRQPGMLEGLSRFLVQHERCGAGFDVAHPAGLGSGRVSITCRGCGARHEYATATIEVERELKIEPVERRRPEPPPVPPPPTPQAPIPPRPAPYPDTTQPPTPPVVPPAERAEEIAARASQPAVPPVPTTPGAPERAAGDPAEVARRRAAQAPPAGLRPPGAPGGPARAESALSRFWHSPRATMALLVIAAVALGFGVVRLVNSGGNNGTTATQPATSPPPAATSPAPTTPAPTTAPSTATPTPVPASPTTTTLRTQRFAIQLPQGWTERTSTGGLLVEPRGDRRVNVQIFYQRSPGLSANQMSAQTSSFLRHEVPGASLFPNQIRIAGAPAREITARGPGETAIAVDVLRGPYRYLLVRRIFAGASPHASDAASLVVMSFSPR
jgi:hypothetical protein